VDKSNLQKDKESEEIPAKDENVVGVENGEESIHDLPDLDVERWETMPKRRRVSRGIRTANDEMWSGKSDTRTGPMDEDGRGQRNTEFALESSDTHLVTPAGGDGDVIDLADILSRQWLPIAAIVALSLIVGGAILSQLTPMYTAKAELIIENQRPALPTLEAILPALGTDEQSILTESEVLRSGILLGAVVERLDLVSDPEFGSSPPGFLSRLTGSEGQASQVATDDRHNLVVNSLARRLNVANIRDSRVITVAVASESPDRAAEIANTLVAEYLESRRSAKFAASSETNSWLDDRIVELQAKLVESEERVEEFRSKAELLEAGGSTLISQQLAELNGHIIVARAATEGARAELTQVSDLIESPDSSGNYASDQLLRSPLVQELRRQQVMLEREVAELSSELGPAHPRMIQLNADAADLENQISIEIDKVEQGLRNAVTVAVAREQGLERQAAVMKRRLSQTNEDEIQLRALERESEANRELLETLLARQKELGSPNQLQVGQPDARVISYATAPANPSFPQMGLSMAAILIASIIVALVVAFIREVRRQGFTTLEQLEAVNKLTALGFIPLVSSRRQQSQMLDAIANSPEQPFAQAMKTLTWQLDESMPSDSCVIQITSAVPGEGKTTTAVGIARTKALKGHKTLLIDADMRNPSVHAKLGIAQSPGLRGVIEEDMQLTEAILTDSETSLDVLPAGSASANALAFVESPRMDSILAELIELYEYIIVDSPPVVTGPDACEISKLADATVFTVRWSDTPVNAVKYALRILERNGVHVTGTILTMVEASRSLNRSHGYFGYYGYYGNSAAN
jgi:capsular exopolysaccharide synthesis family protein